MLETALQPPHPYSLELSARFEADGTRRLEGGVLTVALAGGGHACVWQRRDGSLGVRIAETSAEVALAEVRFLLSLDVDLSPFDRLARSDRLLRDVWRRREGYRPMRVATVAHALLRALAGQLITAREARDIERRLIRRYSPPCGGLRRPPTRAMLAALSSSDAEACGLSPRRSEALVRVARHLDLERLRRAPSAAVRDRLCHERSLGPWSAGVVCLYGLGRFDCGLVGDLGLVRLLSALEGRPVDPAETARLLEPYGEWAGLASLLLLTHPLAARGTPVSAHAARRPRRRTAKPAPV